VLRIQLAEAQRSIVAGANLDQALAGFSPGDRPFAQALLYAACRHHYSNQALIARLCDRRPKPAIAALLHVALTELRYLSTPAHAAVHEAVAAARALQASAAGFVNALLRRFLRERESLLGALDGREARYEHPMWLLEAIERDWPEQLDAICAAANAQAPMWLRVDARGPGAAAYREQLALLGIDSETTDDVPSALKLRQAQPVDALPGFAEGAASVQDASAQRVVGALRLRPGLRVLDACAAPGGKTAALLEAEPGLRMLAVERDAQRAERLRATLARCRVQAEVRIDDAAALPADVGSFDRILIDAPCTGSGVIRRHPDIKLLRRPSDVGTLAAQQARLLDALWPRLKPDGVLVYATCSILRAENSQQIEAFLARTPDARALPWPAPDFGIDTGSGRQNLSGVGDEDGFFYAILGRR
jgi:16S rRNA (cytosine967-C5)-methyltransferase